MLEVQNIDVFYGDLQVLWDVSFEVEEGEIVALVGANGSGKSTTLKTLSGLLNPANGSIRFLDQRLDKIPANKIIEHGVVHVPEGRRLFPEMTVRENLIMGSLSPQAKGKRDETMEWVFGLFPRLREREKQLAGTLSGGEQQARWGRIISITSVVGQIGKTVVSVGKLIDTHGGTIGDRA